MSTKILLKKSSTAGAVPLTTDLEIGEVALNLADRKLYAKNNSNLVVPIGAAYVGATAPTAPAEGDLWYDSANDTLKVYNGTAWTSSSSSASSLSSLTDVTITSIAAGELLKWTGSGWINNTLAEAGIQPAGSYLTAEADTLATVTGRGATTATAVTLTNATASTTVGTGALIVSGGVGIAGGLNVGGAVVVTGDLTVNGTTTTVNSNNVSIGDSIIILNADEVGTPTQNAGFEVERGTSTNVQFVWNETNDAWDMGDYTLQNVRLDGGTY
jgi:hypothetical protein